MAARVGRGSLLQELGRVNPWWTNSDWESGDPVLRAAASAPYKRHPTILDDIAPPNVYTLRGPRRTGKSTLIKQTVARLRGAGIDPRRICYFSADSIETHRDLINVFQAARQLFPDLGDSPRYFFIDEITSIAEWQRGVKWVRDNTNAALDCLVLTGSSASDVTTGAVHLAGRRGPAVGLDRLLLPMSFPEFARCAGFDLPTPARPVPLSEFYADEGRLACHDALVHLATLVSAFDAYLLIGGFPQAVSDFRRAATVSAGLMRDMWDIVQSDLQKHGVSRPEQCLRLLGEITTSTASPTSMQTLADKLGVDRRTTSNWIDALANSYLLLVLFKESGGMPDVNSLRKTYPIDPLVATLPSWQSPGVTEVNSTQLAEAAIAMALLRSVDRDRVDHFRQPARLCYFRSAGGKEVDFIVFPDRNGIEVKYVDTSDRRELRAMLVNFGEGIMLTRSAVDIQPKGTILPASVFAWLLDQGE